MNKYYTYCYRDPSRNNEPIYVGKGCEQRAYRHLTSIKGNPMFLRRLRKMGKNGVLPVIDFLCVDVDEELAFLCEEEAIRLFGRKNLKTGTLLNLTDGGDGPSGRIVNAETKKILSELNKGKSLSAETRRRISESRKGRACSAETKKKISMGTAGVSKGVRSVEHRKKLSISRLGRGLSAETKLKISRSLSKPKPKILCPHCGKSGDAGSLARWHFDNCKKKETVDN